MDLNVLPRDVMINIMKIVCLDIDSRIQIKFIGKLRIPETLQSLISKTLRCPSKLAHNIYGIKLGNRMVVFRRIIESKMFQNSCTCDEYVQENENAETIKLTLVLGIRKHQEMMPSYIDYYVAPIM